MNNVRRNGHILRLLLSVVKKTPFEFFHGTYFFRHGILEVGHERGAALTF